MEWLSFYPDCPFYLIGYMHEMQEYIKKPMDVSSMGFEIFVQLRK